MNSNHQASQKWMRARHERTKYLQAKLDIAGMSRGSKADIEHRDLRATETARSEEWVVRALAAVERFTNPSDIDDHDKLVLLSSGATVPSEIEKDVLCAEAAGKKSQRGICFRETGSRRTFL